ncbi:MAG: hypothetical protein FWD79_09755 [Desulfobulbus sp.]|nr:hypothetical protein [Desulfobulbus sp.]
MMDDLRPLADTLGVYRAGSKKGIVNNIMAASEDKVRQAMREPTITSNDLFFSTVNASSPWWTASSVKTSLQRELSLGRLLPGMLCKGFLFPCFYTPKWGIERS